MNRPVRRPRPATHRPTRSETCREKRVVVRAVPPAAGLLMRAGPTSPTPQRAPRSAPRGLNYAAQIAAERQTGSPLVAGSEPGSNSEHDSESEELVLPEDLREIRARAAEARRARMSARMHLPRSTSSTVDESMRSTSAPVSRPSRALPRVPATSPLVQGPETTLNTASQAQAMMAARASRPRRSRISEHRSLSQDPVPAPPLAPSPELGGPGGLGAIVSDSSASQDRAQQRRAQSALEVRHAFETHPPAEVPAVPEVPALPSPPASQEAQDAGAQDALTDQEARESLEVQEAREAQATREAQAALRARLEQEAQVAQAARVLRGVEHAEDVQEVPQSAPEPALQPELDPAPEREPERESQPEREREPEREPEPRQAAPEAPTELAAVEEVDEPLGALPTAPLQPLAMPETSARASRSRRERRRSRRSGPTHSLLQALATPTTGPGNLLPSLYGYFSNEPAPTSLRPAGVGYGANGHARMGHHNWHAPGSVESLQTGAGGESIGRMHPGLTERILASGPSVSNLHPISSKLLMSPGADARATAAQLRKSQVQPGSVAFPAGTLSGIGTNQAHARDAQLSRKFEENSVVSFSWMIEQAAEFVEQIQHGKGRHEAWNMYPLFGEERWRLELVRSSQDENSTLVLHLTCLAMMGLKFPAELPTQVMIGIRTPQQLHRMPNVLASDYVWREFLSFKFLQQHDTLTFDKFPAFSELLSTTSIGEQNAMELVVQIAAGPSVLPEHNEEQTGDMRLPFQTPNAVQVPRSLMHALANLVDDASTGDLMITVREKGLQQQPSQELAESVGLKTFVQPWPTGTPMPMLPDDMEPVVFVRDRVLWGHASVLRARSEFFDTMLESNFSESLPHDPSGATRGQSWRRPYRILRIPDADYVTLYWFLRYLYTEEVQLLQAEDIQAVTLDDHWILGQEAASSRPDWKWRKVEALGEEVATPHDSPVDDTSFSRLSQQRSPLLMSATTNPVLSDFHSGQNVEVTSNDEGFQYTMDKTERRSNASPAHAPGASDPHPHPPMLPVPPASALALYRLAHRYHIPALCDLTTAHIIAQLTPQNATNYLLCTALFEQLQYSIQHYICTCMANAVQHWQAVSSSEEFERCCDQVSEGEWGPTAGRALASLMRNLRLAGGRT